MVITNVRKNNNKFIQYKYLTNYKNKTIAIDLSNYLMYKDFTEFLIMLINIK